MSVTSCVTLIFNHVSVIVNLTNQICFTRDRTNMCSTFQPRVVDVARLDGTPINLDS